MKKFFYRVLQEDTIISIADKFDLSVTALIKLNNLTRDVEQGDMLYIETDKTITYKVQPTDTLRSVAKKFGVDERDLAEYNGLPYLFYGIKIKIKN